MNKQQASATAINYQREKRQAYILRHFLFAGLVTLIIGALFA